MGFHMRKVVDIFTREEITDAPFHRGTAQELLRDITKLYNLNVTRSLILDDILMYIQRNAGINTDTYITEEGLGND